jgi:hypothetical protein
MAHTQNNSETVIGSQATYTKYGRRLSHRKELFAALLRPDSQSQVQQADDAATSRAQAMPSVLQPH